MSAKKTDATFAAADPAMITDTAVTVETPAAAHSLPPSGGSYVLIDGVLVEEDPDAAAAAVKEV